jgi:hypothetical protein
MDFRRAKPPVRDEEHRKMVALARAKADRERETKSQGAAGSSELETQPAGDDHFHLFPNLERLL